MLIVKQCHGELSIWFKINLFDSIILMNYWLNIVDFFH